MALAKIGSERGKKGEPPFLERSCTHFAAASAFNLLQLGEKLPKKNYNNLIIVVAAVGSRFFLKKTYFFY